MNNDFIIGRKLKPYELEYWEEYRVWKTVNDALNNFNFDIPKNINLNEIEDTNKEIFISTSFKKKEDDIT